MKNLGTAIAAFAISGGWLIAINKLGEFQDWIRKIPADYVLTPLVLLLVVTGALFHINRKQRRQLDLSQVARQPRHNERDARFVTHLGVWWKVHTDGEYIEDFPYCPCCNPPKKLVQTEWHPDEVFKCPATSTEVKLYDAVPRKLRDVLQSLYSSYFSGHRLYEELDRRLSQRKELFPQKNELELLREVLESDPFNRIPKEERETILARFPKLSDAMQYFLRHGKHYSRYVRKGRDDEV